MQEEVESRTVNLAVSTTKLSARTIVSAVRAYLNHRQNVAVKKEHPEVWELVVGGIGGLVSGFLVKKDMNEPSEATPANIDFDNLD